MGDIKTSLQECLTQLAERLRGVGLEREAAQTERLAGRVEHPCAVAVVGQVKAGKSTFINALLGDDLAKTGTTETTATINYFRYGQPDPARPVRCHWRGGGYEDVGRDFLDGLQGNDIETLRRADGIRFLEYFLPNPYLKEVTLIDTPGTGAVVGEHQDRTAEFMGLYGQLRDRHSLDTRRIGGEADAVIYLVGPVARVNDQAFLEQFSQATGGRSRALNAVGVMSKIDLQPEVVARRRELAEKIGNQLKDQLNMVVPVSAGLRRALDRLCAEQRAALKKIVQALRSIPPGRLKMLLSGDELFCEYEGFSDCPVPAAERRALRGEMPWGVFTTVARAASDASLTVEQVEASLDELAGFTRLKELLERHFFRRGHILHYYRLLEEARHILSSVKYEHIPKLRAGERERRARLARFLDFVAGAKGAEATAVELAAFLRESLAADERSGRLEALWEELDCKLEDLHTQLVEYNADFGGLQKLDERTEEFSKEESVELRSLLGLYGMEIEKRLPPHGVNARYLRERQLYWRQAEATSPRGSARQLLADRAQARYGLTLSELQLREQAASSNEPLPKRGDAVTPSLNRADSEGG